MQTLRMDARMDESDSKEHREAGDEEHTDIASLPLVSIFFGERGKGWWWVVEVVCMYVLEKRMYGLPCKGSTGSEVDV